MSVTRHFVKISGNEMVNREKRIHAFSVQNLANIYMIVIFFFYTKTYKILFLHVIRDAVAQKLDFDAWKSMFIKIHSFHTSFLSIISLQERQ